MKNLLLTIDLGDIPDHQVRAMQMQMSDWMNANKPLPFKNIIIMPTRGETRLYWLEGEIDNQQDIKDLDSVKDKLEPLLSVALDLKIDRKKKYKNPYTKIRRLKDIDAHIKHQNPGFPTKYK